jgi:nitrogen regulatory protein P-II 1
MKQITAIIQPHMLGRVEHAIHKNAHTGMPGDGLIAVQEVVEILRIGSGEHGEGAV